MIVNDELITAMEAVPTPLALMHAVRDDQGTMVDLEWDYINAAGAREILVSRDELIGQRLLVKLPDHRNGLFEMYVNVVETGEPMIIDSAGLDDDWGTQEVIPRVYDIRATRAGDGVFIWWADVTERAEQNLRLSKAAHEGELLELIIETSPIGMAQVNETGAFVTANSAFGKITGRAADELIGMTFAEITHPDDLEIDLAYLEQLIKREIDSYAMDKRYILPDGSTVWVRLRASAAWADDGTFVTYIAQVVDITQEKLLIEQLERSNHDLKHFAFVASHDLQAPLRIASTYSELLFAELPPEALNDERREFMSEITTSLEQMRMLVADLLDFSRATSTEIPQEPVEVADVIAQAIDQVQFEIAETDTDVTVDLQPDLTVLGSGPQLLRVFVNLLTNSIRYHSLERPNRIAIEGRSHRRKAQIYVKDNGVGIPAAVQDKAFSMFQRLNSDTEGTGLGLALVRSIVERHGGKVELSSDGASGTTVRVELPLA